MIFVRLEIFPYENGWLLCSNLVQTNRQIKFTCGAEITLNLPPIHKSNQLDSHFCRLIHCGIARMRFRVRFIQNSWCLLTKNKTRLNNALIVKQCLLNRYALEHKQSETLMSVMESSDKSVKQKSAGFFSDLMSVSHCMIKRPSSDLCLTCHIDIC